MGALIAQYIRDSGCYAVCDPESSAWLSKDYATSSRLILQLQNRTAVTAKAEAYNASCRLPDVEYAGYARPWAGYL